MCPLTAVHIYIYVALLMNISSFFLNNTFLIALLYNYKKYILFVEVTLLKYIPNIYMFYLKHGYIGLTYDIK